VRDERAQRVFAQHMLQFTGAVFFEVGGEVHGFGEGVA
jgi:hypothetical protein